MTRPYYERDGVTLHHGDCLEVMAGLEDASVDAVITDPPYSSGGMFRGDRVNATTDEKYTQNESRGRRPNFTGDNMDQRAWSGFGRLWMAEARRLTPDGAHLGCFTDWRQLPLLTDVVQHAGWVWRGVLVWDKGESARTPHNGYFGYQCEYIVWATHGPVPRKPTLAKGGEGKMHGCFRRPVTQADKHHQTGKPTPVMEWLVRCCPPGGMVLDLFAGSGTTGVACLRTGRRFVGVELSEAYCEVAARRLEAEPALTKPNDPRVPDLPHRAAAPPRRGQPCETFFS